MQKRILSFLQDQGYDEHSPMKLWQINNAFDKIISTQDHKRQFPRMITDEVWQLTQKNQDNQVVLAQFLENMETQDKLVHLLPESYTQSQRASSEPQQHQTTHPQTQQPHQQQDIQFPTSYKPQSVNEQQQVHEPQPAQHQQPTQLQQPTQKPYQTPYKQLQQNTTQLQLQEYSQRQSIEVRNQLYNDSVSHNINGTVAQSQSNAGSLLGQESLAIETKVEEVKQKQNEQHKEKNQPIAKSNEREVVEKQQQIAQPKTKTNEIQQNTSQPLNQQKSSSQRLQEIIVDQSEEILMKNATKTPIHSINSNASQNNQKKQEYPSQTQQAGRKKKQKKKKLTDSPKKHTNSLKRPLLQYDHEPTQQQIQEELVKDIPRPTIKNKSGIKSIVNRDETTTKYGASSTFLTDRIVQQGEHNLSGSKLSSTKSKICMNKKWFIPMCLFVFGLVIFMSSFIIHSELKKLAAQQVVLSPQTQNVWAHFPGDTKTQIDRNWTFFNITNPDQMLFYNERPKFHEIQGFKIIQEQDYLNITYIQDGDRVQMIDWLHFAQQPDSRNLDQKVKVLNVGGLAYWYNIKVARPTIILQQGLGLLFNTLQNSILQNIYAQAINVQFLPEWSDDIYAELFAPVQIPFLEAWFIWTDPAYGMGNQNNLKYWIEAVISKNDADNQTVSQGFNFLMDYFTLSLGQLRFISMKFEDYVEFAVSSVLQNSYCVNQTDCTGRFLAYQQFSSSYVTRNPPPGKPITPNDTICLSNVTCAGYYPELSAFYKNVYLQRHPDKESKLEFDPEWMKNLVNYNASIDKDLDFNTAQNCLFHIGNLDAIWDNGTLYEKSLQQREQSGLFQAQMQVIQNKYLQNIKTRFNLPSLNHTHVFWQWIKYLNNEVILQNQTNQQLGVANLFANGLYQGFSYLQDNLQQNLLTDLIHYDLANQAVGDCSTFIQNSFQLRNNQTALKICDKYGQKITKQLVKNLLSICTNEFKQGWHKLRHGYDLTLFELGSLCEYDLSNQGTFGYFLHYRRQYLNDIYDCQITPKNYCSDYELAAIQWSSSKVTLNPPPELNLSPNHTYKAWDKNASRFQYTFYASKYPKDQNFPQITTRQAYALLNFDNWFSSTIVLKHFTNDTYNEKFKAYMRYVGIEVGLNGLTIERSARELIFGYKDQILEQVKNAYPPFGGDPSTPSLVAFNDPNITKEQATMTLQWSTGKYNSSLVGQYRKINGHQYLTIQKDFFNGNMTKTLHQSPWQGQDYVYGTSAKQFAPNQFDQPNISLYVPNIQRYGSGIIDQTSTQQRFGFDLQLGYLGESIYQCTSQSDINKKYYQNFHAIFNETSVVGFPLFVTKNHFMNVSSNWSQLVEIYNQNGTIHYVNASQYDDSFVVVQPYTGLSFQSTVYLQSNYYHTPDSLLSFYKESLLPVFSLARSGNVTESVANDLLGPLKMGLSAVKWTKIIGIILVVISCIVCGYIYYRKKKQDRKLGLSERSSQKDSQQQDGQKQRSEKQQSSPRRQIKSSQLGISLQPMPSSSRPGDQLKDKYIPPPVVQQQI